MNVTRVVALATAAFLAVTTFTFAAVVTLSGHLDATTAPYVASAFVALTASVPALIAVATTQSVQATAGEIQGLVNGHYSQAMRVLGEIGSINPTRRSSDAALDASHAMDAGFTPAPPSAVPVTPPPKVAS